MRARACAQKGKTALDWASQQGKHDVPLLIEVRLRSNTLRLRNHLCFYNVLVHAIIRTLCVCGTITLCTCSRFLVDWPNHISGRDAATLHAMCVSSYPMLFLLFLHFVVYNPLVCCVAQSHVYVSAAEAHAAAASK